MPREYPICFAIGPSFAVSTAPEQDREVKVTTSDKPAAIRPQTQRPPVRKHRLLLSLTPRARSGVRLSITCKALS
jgi:hypothetical protein